jgi:hypothetical protein
VIDYPDGAMSGIVAAHAGVERVPFTDGEPVTVASSDLLVMQAILPATLKPELTTAPDTRVLFWVLYMMNYVQTLVPIDRVKDWQTRSLALQHIANRTVLAGFQRQLRRFLHEITARGSLAFMDGSTWRATCDRVEIDLRRPRFLPVMVDVPAYDRAARPTPDVLRMGWVGRLDDFKMGALNHTIATLSAIAAADGRRIELLVIGDGPLADRLASKDHDRFRVVRSGTVPASRLGAALREIDLLFAMGASALEGARQGVPTVLLDFSYGPFPPDYRFRWLYDAADYDLGQMIDASCRGESSIDTLRRILQRIDADADAVSRETYAYCRDRHSIEACVPIFLDAAAHATFRFADIDPELRRKSWIRRQYERARRGPLPPVAGRTASS